MVRVRVLFLFLESKMKTRSGRITENISRNELDEDEFDLKKNGQLDSALQVNRNNVPLSIEVFRGLFLKNTIKNINSTTLIEELENLSGYDGVDYCSRKATYQRLLKRVLYYKKILLKEDIDNGSILYADVIEFGSGSGNYGLGVFSRIAISRGALIPLYGWQTNVAAVNFAAYPVVETNYKKSSKKLQERSTRVNLHSKMDGSLALCNHSCGTTTNCSFSIAIPDKNWKNAINAFKKETGLQASTRIFHLVVNKEIRMGEEITVNYNDPPPNCACKRCTDTSISL